MIKRLSDLVAFVIAVLLAPTVAGIGVKDVNMRNHLSVFPAWGGGDEAPVSFPHITVLLRVVNTFATRCLIKYQAWLSA